MNVEQEHSNPIEQINDSETSIVENISHSQDVGELKNEQELQEEAETHTYIYDLNLQQLVDEINKYNAKDAVLKHRTRIELIRAEFYKKLKQDSENAKNLFIQNGGEPKNFVYSNPIEQDFKHVYSSIKEFKAELLQEAEREKQLNLQKRLAIIEELKELVTKQESSGKTFNEFKSIQERWRAIGAIPQSEIKSIWEQYHHHVGVFYDYIKINKALRDLDLKKNLEAKMQLCEKAEALLLEPQIVKAFAQLQKLHDLWREVGPVADEKKDEIWNRFKEATNKLNKAHQEYFAQLKEQEKTNYELKSGLCERVEHMLEQEFTTLKQWNEASEEISAIQKTWKTIGFAPQKYNTAVYERFCKACDDFFAKKREFFLTVKEEEDVNKQKRIDICVQAEQMKTRTDWKQATQDFLDLQQAWKEIGPVSHKESTKLWNRFRAACDEFFNARQQFYKDKESEQQTNYQLKLAVIEKIKNIQTDLKPQDKLLALQALQKEWTEIGFVPAKKKDALQKQYKEAVQKQFDAIQLPTEQKQKALLEVKVHTMLTDSKGDDMIHAEIAKLQNRIRVIEGEISVLENNIGFFSKSKNSEKIIEDFNKKVAIGKEEIESIKQQIRVIKSIKQQDEK
jgi:hypothetical protein